MTVLRVDLSIQVYRIQHWKYGLILVPSCHFICWPIHVHYCTQPLIPSCKSFYFCYSTENCILVHFKCFAVSGKHSGISGYGIYSNYWTVHCLCPTHLLQSDFGTQVLYPRTFQLGPLWDPCWLDCRSLGGNHLSPLLIACILSHYK